jgi:hypothetical protein
MSHGVVAYAWYSVFEWGLLVIDIGFDAALLLDFVGVSISISFPGISAPPAPMATHAAEQVCVASVVIAAAAAAAG